MLQADVSFPLDTSVPDFSMFFASREMRNQITFLENSQEFKKILQNLYFSNNVGNIYLNFYSCLT